MTKSQLKLMANVFRRRINQGETFEDIAADYPKLTAEDLEQIREALNQ